jgi:hypothetical protein
MTATGSSVQLGAAPPKVQQEAMYGDTTVDLGAPDEDYLKLGGGDCDGGPRGVPSSDSWLDLKAAGGGKEKRGMHVTFSVRDGAAPGTHACLPPEHHTRPSCMLGCGHGKLLECRLQWSEGVVLAHDARTYACMHAWSLQHGMQRSAGWRHDGSMSACAQDVYYIVKNRANKAERLSILSGVSGFFRPGEMAAVMGPSGSGAALADLFAAKLSYTGAVCAG